jgi:serine/threonine protein kinase
MGALLHVEKLKGSGVFGRVVRASIVRSELETALDCPALVDGAVVAVKQTLRMGRICPREVTVLRTMDHPNVVKLIDFAYTAGSDNGGGIDPPGAEPVITLHMVLEYQPMSLRKLLRLGSRHAQANHLENLALRPAMLRLIAWQLLAALAHVHSRGVLHRDLKPDNVLYDHRSNRVVLADFGAACSSRQGDPRTCGAGAMAYRAPECLLGSPPTQASDVWSAGLVLLEMACARYPLPTPDVADPAGHVMAILDLCGTAGLRYDPVGGAQGLPAALAGCGATQTTCLVPELPQLAGDTAMSGLLARMMATDPLRRPRASQLLGDAAFAGTLKAAENEGIQIPVELWGSDFLAGRGTDTGLDSDFRVAAPA